MHLSFLKGKSVMQCNEVTLDSVIIPEGFLVEVISCLFHYSGQK